MRGTGLEIGNLRRREPKDLALGKGGESISANTESDSGAETPATWHDPHYRYSYTYG